MHVITAINVNDAYVRGLRYLAEHHIEEDSRNGPVLVFPGPVTTHYQQPDERVLFSPQRDANPFFHLFEALWMLTGAADVALPAYFVPRMREFSDDGTHFHAAYGYRWRTHFGIDQIAMLIAALRHEPNSRRAVISMWDPRADLGRQGKDFPCNTTIEFGLRAGALNMIVFNRSNDIILGCYGANVVHMSILQEYIAAMLDAEVGYYEQVSCNYHAYLEQWNKVWPMGSSEFGIGINPYYDSARILHREPVIHYPLVTYRPSFDNECKEVVGIARGEHTPEAFLGMQNSFFTKVCQPLLDAFQMHKRKHTDNGINTLTSAIEAYGNVDWLVAGKEWLQRRSQYK